MKFKIVTLLSLFLFSVVLHAHHSDVGLDDDSIVVIEGIVTEFSWRQPHVYIEVETIENGEKVIGQFNEIESVKALFERLYREYLEASEAIAAINADLIE